MNKYDEILKKIDDITAELNDSTLSALSHEAKLCFWKPVPEIAFADLGGVGSELLQLMEQLTGVVVSKERRKELMGSQWTIVAAKTPGGEQKADSWDTTADGDILVYGDSPLLHKYNLKFVCTDEEHAASGALAASEQLYMLTNASMAMTQMQKQWVDTFVKARYDSDRFHVLLWGLEALDTDEAEEEVLQYVDRCLGDKNMTVVHGMEGALQSVDHLGELGAQLREQSRRRVLQNLILDMEQALQAKAALMGASNLDVAQLHRQMEKAKPRLMAAGKITAKVALHNEVAQVIQAVRNSAVEYNKSMCESICNVVEQAKDLVDTEEKIGPYMEESWRHFASETNDQLEKSFDHIMTILMARMEQDIYDVLADMPEEERTVLCRLEEAQVAISGPRRAYSEGDNSALIGFSKEARNTMLLAAPMLFLNPTLALACLIGGGLYGRYEQKQKTEAYRKELLAHVRRSCDDICKSVIGEINEALLAEEARISRQLLDCYSGIAEQLQKQIDAGKQLVEEERKRLARVSHVWEKELPALRSSF